MSVDLAGFVGVVLLAYLVPGPDFLVIVRAAVRRAAFGRAAALGAQAGLCVHMGAAVLGLSVIAAGSALAFTAVKLAGAAYLAYLGVRVLLAGRRSRGRDVPATGGAEPGARRDAPADAGRGRRGSFVQGFTTNVLNPKAALFFLSVLPQFIRHGGSPTEEILVLGALDIGVGVVYWMLVVRVAARLRSLWDRPAWRRRWDRVTGWLFIAVGAGVATT